MSASRKILTITLLGAATIGVVIAVRRMKEIKQEADEVADNIESELDDLDPITRKAVMARLASDAVKDVHARAAQST